MNTNMPEASCQNESGAEAVGPQKCSNNMRIGTLMAFDKNAIGMVKKNNKHFLALEILLK